MNPKKTISMHLTVLTSIFFLIGSLTACGGMDNGEMETSGFGTEVQEVRGGTGDSARPWMVSFQRRSGGRWVNLCGGSLIRNNVVLTAAHCIDAFKGLGLNKVRACVGVRNIASQCTAAVNSDVTRAQNHPNWNSQGSDLGIVRLAKSFPNNAKMALAGSNQMPGNNQRVILHGWGLDNNGRPKDILQKLAYRTIGLNTCRQSWGGLSNRHLCVQATQAKGACNGDSGGPLRFNNRQVGIVSFGVAECGGTAPDVYTSVGAFRGWINRCADNAGSCSTP